MSQTYEYYVNLWLEGVSMQSGDDPDCIEPRSGWEWWLKQPWAQEKNCIDFPD